MKELYKKLIKEYLQKGGKQAFVDKLSPVYSLQSEAKLRFELQKLNSKASSVNTSQNDAYIVENKTVVSGKEALKNLNKIGLISEYPHELHSLYNERQKQFINACSLKMQLNEVDAADDTAAYELQKQIMECFKIVNNANETLNHYRKFKRVLPQKNTIDFSKLSQAEMIQQRNRLRSNISNRQRTVKKLQKELENAADKDKVRLSSKLTQKIEQLKNFKLQVAELDRFIA